MTRFSTRGAGLVRRRRRARLGGLYMVLVAEVGGREQAGLTTGVGVAFLLAGILPGGPLFGLVLEHTDSYAVA